MERHRQIAGLHLYEKNHRGTLTGAWLTDTKIMLVAGKAHLKHTEGGDFREATYRAVRHGLMKSGCTLLEPYYKFRLEIPTSCVGRAMSDLQARFAEFEIENSDSERSSICGRGPVSTLNDYTKEVISYTRGEGRLFCTSDGYEPCHNQDEIVEACAYDPEADLDNPPHSVFCAHGAGFTVHWSEVDNYKHLESNFSVSSSNEAIIPKASTLARKYSISDEELEAEYKKLADAYKMDVEKIRTAIAPEMLKKDIEANKAIAVVRDSAKITEKAEGEEKPKKKAPAKKTAEKAEEGEKKAPAKKTTSTKSTTAKSTTTKTTTAKKTTATKAKKEETAE